MSILCSAFAIKAEPEPVRTIKNIIFDSKVNILPIHVTGGVSVWFFNPFLMYPLSLQELGSDNTAYRKIPKISPD